MCIRDSYSPTYTSKGKKRYSYYISQNLLQYRDHPKGLLARIPANEIEKTVTSGLKSWLLEGKNLMELLPSIDTQTLKWISNQYLDIQHESVRAILNMVVLAPNQITLKINTSKFQQYLTKTLDIEIEAHPLKAVSYTHLTLPTICSV